MVAGAQVHVAVVTQTVTVRHDPAQSSAAALAAALNAVRLEASLEAPREQPNARGRWVPPIHLVGAAVLLLISLAQYLDGPTGAGPRLIAFSPHNSSTPVVRDLQYIDDPYLIHALSLPIRGLHSGCEACKTSPSTYLGRQIRTCDRQDLSLHLVLYGDSDWRTVRTSSWDPKSVHQGLRADLTLVQAQVSIQS